MTLGCGGYGGLIDELLKKLKRDQGIDARPENVLITAGGSQALALLLDDPGIGLFRRSGEVLEALFPFHVALGP